MCLAVSREHGTRSKYVHERCRCEECRAANAAYARGLNSRKQIARARPEFFRLVDADVVRDHIKALSRQGIGRRQVSKLAGVSNSMLATLLYGRWRGGSKRPPSQRVNRDIAARILAIGPNQHANHALVNAAPVWRQVDELLAFGVKKAWIANAIGLETRALQLGKERVTARNARRVAAVHWSLWLRSERFRESCTCSVPRPTLARTVLGEEMD